MFCWRSRAASQRTNEEMKSLPAVGSAEANKEGTETEPPAPQSLSCLPVRSGSGCPALPRCMVGTSGPAYPICLSVFSGLLPHFGHHFRALIYSLGPGRGHSFKDLSVEPSPLRTLRGRKMLGEDGKESKRDLIPALPAAGQMRKEAGPRLLRDGSIQSCQCSCRRLRPHPAFPGRISPQVLGDGAPDYNSICQCPSLIPSSCLRSHMTLPVL